MARKTRQVETRMTAEYLMQEFPQFPHLQAVPLGVVSEALMASEGYEKAIRMSRPYRPECDALVILPNYLLLIECKVWNIVDGLAKLPLYRDLIPSTPELKHFPQRQYECVVNGVVQEVVDYVDLTQRDIIMRLVVGWTNTNLETMARGRGVEIKIYAPQWLADVVDGMHKYWTPEYQAARSAKLAAREYFGVE